ncbi:MAG: hypothetical protein CME68_03940 [Halobacteriovoraceae bacterium]|nr:hypothetical protein [Halobacteriovoraceae bacterium]
MTTLVCLDLPSFRDFLKKILIKVTIYYSFYFFIYKINLFNLILFFYSLSAQKVNSFLGKTTKIENSFRGWF